MIHKYSYIIGNWEHLSVRDSRWKDRYRPPQFAGANESWPPLMGAGYHFRRILERWQTILGGSFV